MRRWFFARATGAMLALMLVVASTATAFADPRDFTLINNTSQVITEVYVSASNQTDWGEDVLGRDVLMPGENVDIAFQRFTPGDCLYDVKVITESGAEGELGQVNLCETTTVTFN
jgi:hypothetical protein